MAATAPSNGRAIWQWETNDMTKAIVQQLRDGVQLDTRSFLRPVFKWMKTGLRKNGQKDLNAIAQTFAYVEWMVQLQREGDAALGIPALPSIQPSYALNTIVTSSQRAGSLDEALRAFNLTLRCGYEPDVFTYTALIDVMARSGDVRGAIEKYHEMRSSTSHPNIVTYTTLIRALVYSDDVDPLESLVFIKHAQDDHTFDEALYLEALEVSGLRNSIPTATRLLEEIAKQAPTLRDSERLIHAIAKVVHARSDKSEVLVAWRDQGIISQTECDGVDAPRALHFSNTSSKTQGCLGNQTSDSVRQAVVQHDLTRLIERIQSGTAVTTNDFETLIHQCRKRKWKEEVAVIVARMREIAANGWHSTSDERSLNIDAQPHLEPSSKTYISIVDAYLCCGDEALAWDAMLDIANFPHLKREYGLYRKYVRGCYLLTNCDHIQDMLGLAKSDNIPFSHRMCVELARMHGYRHEEGLDIVLRQLPIAVEDKRRTYMEELIKSCAYKHNTAGVEATLRAHLDHGFGLSAATEMAVFICCMQYNQMPDALQMLHHFQAQQLMMKVPMYESLLRELYFKYTRRSGEFDSASRGTALKVLHLRRALFEHMFREKEAFEQCVQSAISEQVRSGCPLQFWCHLASLECAPLMFAQHVVEVITTLRDKEGKARAQDTIREALLLTSDPFLYNLRAVVALRWLDLTYRSQGKMAKLMLGLLTDHIDRAPIHPHHADFCLSHLPSLTVHVVKELDDVVALHQHDRLRMLEFCLEALEKDNMDKTIGYIVTKPDLYNLETTQFFAPKLAELFVIHGYPNAMQFFRTDIDDTDEMRRIFLREVIELESLVNETGTGAMPCTIKAITEFKLEHEAEFMPYLLRVDPSTNSDLVDAEGDDGDDTEYLQLPIALSNVLLVDNEEALATAYDVLLSPSIDRIALDAEWRPDNGHLQSKCSILQVACSGFVFLFDLKELVMSELEDLFAPLFASTTVRKLGFGLQGDIKRLRWSFPDTPCFEKFENVHDFADDEENAEPDTVIDVSMAAAALKRKSRRRNRGLSAYVNDVIGLPLCKRQQKSDWERRPLSPQQVSYAALDAYCLLMLDDILDAIN